MKKKRILLMVLAVFCLLSTAALAEDWQQILFSEPWTGMDTNGGRFAFEQGGGGTLTFSGDYTLPLEWSMEGDLLTLSYELYGTRTFSYLLKEQDGMYCLQFQGEGSGLLLRVSDRDALLAADRGAVNAFPAELGQQLRLGFVNLTLDSVKVSKQLELSDGVKISATEGSQYVGLFGTIDNPGGQAVNAGNISAELLVDGEYAYSATTYLKNSNLSDKSVKPLQNIPIYIVAQVPDELARSFSECSLTFGFQQQMKEKPLKLSSAEFIFRIDVNQQTAAEAQKREMVYFEHCPVLPEPTSFFDVMRSGSNVSKSNGKVTRVVMRYQALNSSDDIAQIMADYLARLQAIGFDVQGDAVFAGSDRVAELTCDGKTLEINIIPGNEDLTQLPTVTSQQPAGEADDLSLGDTLQAQKVSMTLQETGVTDRIYSSITKQGTYTYYYSQSGEPYFYLFGSLTNTGKTPVDIRNIYVEFIFDGEYHYRGDVAGVRKGASSFINDVSAQSEVNYYVYGEVPQSVLDSYQTCIVRLGFTDDFGIKVVSAGGLNLFERCDEVMEVKIER